MKPNITLPQNYDDIDERSFGIGDPALVFDILRCKIYSRPIDAICREISCNARDAHREVGKSEVPIEIHLPTAGEPFYKVKDFGPGISPDRMNGIFINYGSSTKHNDDQQCGMFGLGAKSPFAYSDSFSVISIVDGQRYNYTCFIDETKVGKLMTNSITSTDQPNGTEIQVPVKSSDFELFAAATEQATRHWTIKPTIRNQRFTYLTTQPILSGDGWFIDKMQGGWHRAQGKLLIDEIEYPLPLDQFEKIDGVNILSQSSRGDIYLTFQNGELSLSANREQVYLDKRSQQAIQDRLHQMMNDIQRRMQERVAQCSNLFEANCLWNAGISNALNWDHYRYVIPSLQWNGIALSTHAYVGVNVSDFSKGRYKRGYKDSGKTDKLWMRRCSQISFRQHTALYVDDLGAEKTLGIKHIKPAFDSDPTLEYLLVVHPTEAISLEKLNETAHLNLMQPKLLSSLTKPIKPRKPSSNEARLTIFKYEGASSGFCRTSLATMQADTNIKVMCRFAGRGYIKVGKQTISERRLSQLDPTVSFYAVDDTVPDKRLKELSNGMRNFEQYLRGFLGTKSSDEVYKVKLGNLKGEYLESRFVDLAKKIRPQISHPQSMFLKWVDLQLELGRQLKNEWLWIYEALHGTISQSDMEKWLQANPDYDFDTIKDQFLSKYPLLDCVYGYSLTDYAAPIQQYINLIDQHT